MKKAIAEIFTTADKPVKSESTLRNYTGHLDRLCRFNETTPLKLFKSKDAKNDILKYINTRKSASTRNQVCCAVKKLAEILDNKDFIKFGEKEVAKTIAIRKGKKEKLKIAKKKSLNWINFDILKMRYDIAVMAVRLYDNQNLKLRVADNVEDYKNNLEMAVLLGLYISNIYKNRPRRAEAWFNTEICKKTPNQKTDIRNYIVLSKGKPVKLVLYKYKTVKNYGRQEFKLNNELSFLLDLWIKYHSDIPGNNLFKKENGEKWSGSQFSNKIKNIIRKCTIRKINISTNMLRNITITEIYKNIQITDMPQCAKDCGHTVEAAIEYYIKANDLPEGTEINLDPEVEI